MGRAIRDERPDMSLLVPLSYNKASAGGELSIREKTDLYVSIFMVQSQAEKIKWGRIVSHNAPPLKC